MFSDNVEYWAPLMRERAIPVPPDPVRIDGPLACGQHRLYALPLHVAWAEAKRQRIITRRRRRRIVRVATLKYRARKRCR